MAKRQPKDPFGGMGDWIPKPKRARKSRIVPAQQSALENIVAATEGALARIDVLDVVTVKQDFQWIRELAADGLRMG